MSVYASDINFEEYMKHLSSSVCQRQKKPNPSCLLSNLDSELTNYYLWHGESHVHLPTWISMWINDWITSRFWTECCFKLQWTFLFFRKWNFMFHFWFWVSQNWTPLDILTHIIGVAHPTPLLLLLLLEGWRWITINVTMSASPLFLTTKTNTCHSLTVNIFEMVKQCHCQHLL